MVLLTPMGTTATCNIAHTPNQWKENIGRAWINMLILLKIPPTEENTNLVNQVIGSHSAKHRSYHNVQRISELLGLYDDIRDPRYYYDKLKHTKDYGLMLAAIFFHDQVYKAGDGANKTKSADEAAKTLKKLGLNNDDINRVKEIILATQTHQAKEDDDLHNYFLDMDRAILGAGPRRYREYALHLRKEFKGISDDTYYGDDKNSRKSYLTKAIQELKQNKFFHTKAFKKRFTEQAIRNINWELEHPVKLQEALSKRR